MKKVTMLNGNLILREKKTGVHFHHEMIVKKLIEVKQLRYDLRVAVFDPKGECKSIAKKTANWIIPYCDFSKFYRLFGFVFPIELFFGKSDIYLCDGLFPKLINRKAKRICLVHDLMVKVYPNYYSHIKRLYLNLFFSKLPKADYIVCSSENTKQDIMKYYGIPEEKIDVTYSGWNIPQICYDEKQVSKDIKDCGQFIFYIGDMRPNKNLSNIIKGFTCFCNMENNNDLMFFIAGNQNGEYDKLIHLVKENRMENRVRFLGYINDCEKEYLYKNANAVVLISEYEGFGIPIMEGLYYGTPVITSNVSSMKEIGEGVSIQVDPFNIEEIALAIHKVYNKEFFPDPRKVSDTLKKYSFDNVAAVVNKAFERLIDQESSDAISNY